MIQDLLSGHPSIRLLYVTPEYCQSDHFRRTLQTVHKQGQLIRISIDEAHCISEWGHDFRPAYQSLGWFRSHLTNPVVPMTALTATATPKVRSDIISFLGLDPSALKQFCTPSARPNIHYEVRYLPHGSPDTAVLEDSQLNDILAWMKNIHDRRLYRLRASEGASYHGDHQAGRNCLPPIIGIIYVPLRSLCHELAERLSATESFHVRAVAYHAGLSTKERTVVQAAWSCSGNLSLQHEEQVCQPAFCVAVATSAFGMGIDNPHVRFVIHWTLPRSFEGFVQESGRAGRDGRAAMSLVYYSTEERDRMLERIIRDHNSYLDIDSSYKLELGENNQLRSRDSLLQNRTRNYEALLQSFGKIVEYCENTTRCRHEIIKDFCGDIDRSNLSSADDNTNLKRFDPYLPCHDHRPICVFACDFCKEGLTSLTRRKEAAINDNLG